MSDFGTQVRDYVNETVPPLDVEALIETLEQAPVWGDDALGHVAKPPIQHRVARFPLWAYGLVAAGVVLVVMGGLAFLLRTGSPDGDDAPVDRPSVTTPTVPETDAVIVPPVRPAEFTATGSWVEIPRRMNNVVAGGPGFLATGSGEKGPMVWSSTDGITWVEQNSPGVIGGIATTPSGLVAVGALPCEISDCETVAAAWTSPDGLNWEIAYRMAETSVPPGGRTSMGGIVTHEKTIVALSQSCSVEERCTTEIWTSLDGVTWVPSESSGIDFSDYRNQIAVGGPGLVMIGVKDDGLGQAGAVWLSEDGTTWTTAETEGLESVVLTLVAARGQGLIAISAEYEVLTSEDGVKWSQVSTEYPFVGGGVVRDLHTISDGRTVAVGSTCEGAAIWITQDGNQWTPIFFELGQLRAIAEGPTRVVAVGAGRGSKNTLIWAAELDSLPTASDSGEPTGGGCQ